MFIVFTAGNAADDTVVGPSNAIYVDIAGSDATGTRGNAGRPFLTLEAASAVAQSGDEILIGPGTFSSTIKPWTTPPVANITVRGSGELAGGTVLTANANIDVVAISNATRSLLMQDLRIAANGTARAVIGDGTGAAGAFGNAGLKFENVDILTGGATADSLNLQFVAEIVLFNVQASAASASFLTCSNIRLRGDTTLGNVQHTWDNSSAQKPAVQVVGLQVNAGSTIGNWTGTGQPRITENPGGTIGTMTGATLSVNTGLAPVFQVHGTVDNCTFTGGATTLPDGAVTATVVNFSGAVLSGTAYTFSDAADVTNQPINFTGVRSQVAVTITSGLRCQMDERGSSFAVQPTYTSAGATLGTHLPPKIVVLGTAAIAATVVPFGFTAGNTNYITNATATAAAGTPVTQGAKAATQSTVNIGGAPAGTLDAIITWL